MRKQSIIGGLSRFGVPLFIGAVLGSAAIARADQTYTLKPNVHPGEKWAFDTTSTMKEKGQILANGQVAQPIDQAMEQHRKGTIQATTVDNGLPSAMVVDFDIDSSNGTGAPGEKPMPFALAGKAVHLSRKDGIVTSDLGKEVDTPTVQEVSHMIEPDTSIYPKTPVAVNDEWDGDTADLAKQFQLAATDKITVRCKLTAVHEVEGRQIADVSVTGSMVKHDAAPISPTVSLDIETRIDLDGSTHIDLQNGQVLGSDVTGKISSRGAKQIADPNGAPVNISFSGDGSLVVHQTVKLLNAAAAGPGFAVRPANPAPANPLAPDMPAPAASAAPFAGNFKGDQVSLELTGAADEYTGTLTVGDKKFPVAAKPDGEKLTGHFESDGTKFAFTASLQGNAMTLNSEGNVYNLKKAVTNPLARPAPRNPLAQ